MNLERLRKTNKPLEFPEAFHVQMHDLLGGEADAFFGALAGEPPVSIRLNPLKPSSFDGEPVPWCETGRYLAARPSFIEDPLLHAGAYYVQEAGSMAIEQLVPAKGPLRVLDLCGAPGGKSTHLLSLLSRDALLVSNESVKSRVPALRHNLARWGYPNQVVTNAKANAFAKLRDYFDVILCDAPCSGEGLFRKDAGAVAHWSPERVAFNAARQRRIVGEVWPALKPGGTFIYSTCTFNRVENEDNVAWMKDTLGAVEDRHGRSLPEGIAANANGSELRIYPHRAGGEGFFAAALRKAGEAPGSHERTKSPRETGRIPDEIKSWIREPRRFEFIRHGDTVSIVPAGMAAAVAALEPVKPVSTGTQVAVMKGAIAIPAPELALSVALNREAFPELKLDREMALQYLRGATEFSQEGGKGFYLVTCEGLPLGFAKKTGRRFNNLLPKSWYIMKRL